MFKELTSKEIEVEAKKYDIDNLSDMIEESSYPRRAFLQRLLAAKVSEAMVLYEDHVRESVYKDFNPKNEFFDELCARRPDVMNDEKYEEKKELFRTRRMTTPGDKGIFHAVEDLRAFEKGREEYKKNILPLEDKMRRAIGLEQAIKNKDKVREELGEIAKSRDNALDSKKLSKALHISLSYKMANLLKKDPSAYDLVPDRIKDNPASPLSEFLYKEWRFHEEKNPEDIKDIVLNEKKDYRKLGLVHLRSDAKMDKELRDDPERAKMERQKLRRRRELKNNKETVER